ncbi:unnamed protein product [Rotaria sp. Silwood1]|nr:unnamed protein product [Rotaria sp. Silwood1]CAF4931528.1 unnamed protein product [Rotaria sp. Silwood1]
MAFSNKVRVEDLITCVICQELFDDPRLLSCSHTYCRKCIEQTASANKDQFECPLHDGNKILEKDTGSLPLNQGIRELVELYGSTQRSNLCTNCRLVVAEYACDTCKNEKFCSECYETVHTSPVMQKHQRLPTSQELPEMPPCEKHPRKQLEYWCYTYGVTKEFETKININFQGIQSSLEYRIKQAEILINAVDNNSKSNQKKITNIMTLLRETIDEHEEAMRQQILTIEKEQKKQLEDYKTPLKHELQNLNIQKVTFEMLFSSKNYIKLLQTKQEFDDYVNKTNGTLKSLQMPSRTEYYLEELGQLQFIQEKIKQCGRYVEVPPYHNAQLEKLIAENGKKQTLNLKGKNLTDSDMKIVADLLRKSTVISQEM